MVSLLAELEKAPDYGYGRSESDFAYRANRSALADFRARILLAIGDKGLMVSKLPMILGQNGNAGLQLLEASGWDTPEGRSAFGEIPAGVFSDLAGCYRYSDRRRAFEYLVRSGDAADIRRWYSDDFGALAAGLLDMGKEPEEILANQDVWNLFGEAERARAVRAKDQY